MAVYKVPQDVEADDKLLGPFSFRQFIYLIIVVGAIAVGWFLSRLFLPLIVLPLPIVVLFGALALPLKKDQPMETYLAALVSFYLKPHRRLWDPDGQQSLVEITAPKTVEVHLTKDLSELEAERRLSYLANIVDSQGWAVRGVTAPTTNSSLNSDVLYEAQQAEDVLDTSTKTATQIESQLDQTDARRREELVSRLQNPASIATPATQVPDPYASLPSSQTTEQSISDPHLTINPYPSMRQSVVQPLSDLPSTPSQPPQTQAESTSPKGVSPDIINLANNPDLSIETISHEANRIKEKQAFPDDEVIIPLH